MITATFDTLAYSKKLKNAGFTEVQAEAQAEAIFELINEKLATKNDIRKLELDIQGFEERLTYKLTLRFGGMLTAGIAILATLLTILTKVH